MYLALLFTRHGIVWHTHTNTYIRVRHDYNCINRVKQANGTYSANSLHIFTNLANTTNYTRIGKIWWNKTMECRHNCIDKNSFRQLKFSHSTAIRWRWRRLNSYNFIQCEKFVDELKISIAADIVVTWC